MSALQRYGFPLLLILICLGVMDQQVDYTQADLGRHLKNGQMILEGSSEQAQAVLHTNYYSYTTPNEPIVNHHWMTGVVFYKLWQAVGFSGLAMLYSAMVCVALLIVYFSALRSTDPLTAAALTFPIAALIGWRAEPRPEGFTYLFMAIFLAILNEWFAGRMRSLWLWVLPVVMGLWINLHVAFIFGFFFLGIFGLKVLFAEGPSARFRLLLAVSAASLAAAFLNPAGLNGILYPLTIFGKIDFPVGELQSFYRVFLKNDWKWPYTWFVACLIGAVVLLVRRPFNVKTFPWPEALLIVAFIYFGLSQIRNIPFALIALVPTVAAIVGPRTKATATSPLFRYAAIGAIVAGIIVGFRLNFAFRKSGGFGVPDDIGASARFLQVNGIRNPMYNDFDIGGYLIFNRFDGTDSTRVYADNRPEAYPTGFLMGPYMRAMTEETVWHEEDAKHHFNAIVLSLGDKSTEGFILRRVRDDEWAPVFADHYALIFVRRTPDNAVLISNNEIPRNRFR